MWVFINAQCFIVDSDDDDATGGGSEDGDDAADEAVVVVREGMIMLVVVGGSSDGVDVDDSNDFHFSWSLTPYCHILASRTKYGMNVE